MRRSMETLLAAALLSTTVHARDNGDTPQIAWLKSAYLACSDAAAQGRLETAQVMRCSVIYEELKRRAFQGDFDRLLAWSRAQPPQPAARHDTPAR